MNFPESSANASQPEDFDMTVRTTKRRSYGANDDESPKALKRKRASRKGQPKKYQCPHEGCDKSYSRAEHLARHDLNHNPKEIYRCGVEGCNHTFVRPDLFARHKAKHEDGSLQCTSPFYLTSASALTGAGQESESRTTYAANENQAASQSWQQSIHTQPLLTPDSSVTQPGTSDGQSMPNANEMWRNSAIDNGAGNALTSGDQANDNFAAWLFDSPGSHNSGFDFTNLPFLDFGMDYSSNDIWNIDEGASNLSNSLAGRTYSTSTITPRQNAFDTVIDSHVHIGDERHSELVGTLSAFMGKKKPPIDIMSQPGSILFQIDAGYWPNLTVQVLESCTSAFWRGVACQMPIVHESTFSCNTCEPLLLLSIIALGAAAVVRSKQKDSLRDYRAFADFVATNLRWEIFTHDDAQPPVHLWVAQTLLLLELYEKMYSSRQLHERAHIHHASTLTLLRRGSPMIGRTDSETPPSEAPTRDTSPTPTASQSHGHANSENWSWWKRWVSNESMNRVVFAAFQMDTLHGCMFGHSADMLPHELRLPLPCDESMWNAKSAEEVRRLENTFAMYRIKPVNFLDGLKRCLHGYEVQTHHFGRMILMAGLLSVGWHISRREKHLQFVETIPSVQEQARWRSLLLQAFEHWRRSFNEVLDYSGPLSRPSNCGLGREASEPTILFHLGHLTMHIDIIDAQIYSGSRRLLGRKLSDRDRSSVEQRMRIWGGTAMARHTALHAFKLLHAALCPDNMGPSDASTPEHTKRSYSCRNDPLVCRPWILYLAGLTIWTYQYAFVNQSTTASGIRASTTPPPGQQTACQYITTCATTDNADRLPLLTSRQGCVAVLQVLSQDFADAEPEILLEASKRLQECSKLLTGTGRDMPS